MINWCFAFLLYSICSASDTGFDTVKYLGRRLALKAKTKDISAAVKELGLVKNCLMLRYSECHTDQTTCTKVTQEKSGLPTSYS